MELSNKISAKLFIGCHITSEMRMHLSKSKKWRQLSIIPIETREANIQEIHFQGKDYFGYYLLTDIVPTTELKKIKPHILSLLKIFCSEYQVDTLKVYILPQIFVS